MGELTRKGESRPAVQADLPQYERAQSTQALQEVPVLQRTGNPHEYLFFALFDGTGQDVNNPEHLPTNVGVLKQQLDVLKDNPDLRIGGNYVKGIGTQDNVATRYADAWIPYTWDDKIEESYRALSQQTWEWQQQDPLAQVRIAEVGYSRGAVLAAGLAQLVDEYGIAHPKGLAFGRDAQGNITVESPRPRLMAPGQVAQAMGLYDPVATNMPDNYDARRAPSVISATALAAKHEQRVSFPHQTLLEPGLSQDRRFANLLVPGGHSNVGGGNRDYGLEAGAFNVMADYLNGLRDKPVFEYRALPGDPALYTVYQARGPTAVPGLDRDGMRNLREELANCKIVDPCRDGEPMNQALAGQFEYRRLQPMAPTPTFANPKRESVPDVQTTNSGQRAPTDPASPDDALLEKLRSAVRSLDQQAGKSWDDTSERLAASALVMAKGKGFAAQDDLQLAFNKPTEKYAAGEIVHLTRLGPNASADPAANRDYMTTSDALSKPAAERHQEVDAIGQTQAQAQLTQQQTLESENQSRSALVR